MKKKKLIAAVQANSLISARYKLSLNEQRIILIMISKISPNDKDFQGYELSVAEIAKLFEMDEKSAYREIILIASNLLKKPLRIKQADGSLLLCNWIAEAVYNTGKLTIKPAPSLKPYLLELRERFTIVPLEQAGKLRSIYSIRIYQFLKQYYNLGSFDLNVSEFREILTLENRYLKFYELRRCVLDVAKKELDEKADLTFTLETIRRGKTIFRLKFIIIKNKKKNKEADLIDANLGTTSYDNKQKTVQSDDLQNEPCLPKMIIQKESEALDKKIFNEFLEEVKENDKFIYEYYLKNGRDDHIQNVFVIFLDKWEKERKARTASTSKNAKDAEQVEKQECL